MSEKINKKVGTKFYLGSFHHPGIANIKDESGAYHVDVNFEPLYENRYKNTFGFYCNIATVEDCNGFFHINPKGKPIHSRRFIWSGNFQEGYCVVRDKTGFFHINSLGEDVYKYRYDYVGDFKNGTAVAYRNGYAFFINTKGKNVFNKKFLYAQNFHKGFAVVVDKYGWFHIDSKGKELYMERFYFVEPFYNCVSFGLDFDFRKVQIKVNGTYVYLLQRYNEINLEGIKTLINKGHKVSLVIRHADRYHRRNKSSWGEELLLTDIGVKRSIELGKMFKGIKLSIYSSPVRRCVETARYILEGIRDKNILNKVSTSSLLGAPGCYVRNNRSVCKPEEFDDFAYNYICQGKAINMYSINEGSNRLLSYIYRNSLEQANLFISHDFIIAVLMHYLGVKEYNKSNLCDYLSGLCVVFKSDESVDYYSFNFV